MTKGLEKLAKQYGVSLSELMRGKFCTECKRLLPSTGEYFCSRYTLKCRDCSEERQVGERKGKPYSYLEFLVKLGRPIKKNEVIHHRDQNHNNDFLENLQLLESQKAHGKLHAAQGFLYAQLMYNPLVELKVLEK